MRNLAVAILLVAAMSLGVGCKKPPAQTNEILIGEYGSMSGTEASFGQSTHNGIVLAIDEANAAGGVLGKQIKLISEDDRGNQDEAATVVKKLIDRDGVLAILGEVASTNSMAGGGVCEQAHVAMITPSSTNPDVTKGKNYVFRICFTDDFQGAVDAKFGLKKGWKKVAVLTCTDSDYSKKLAQYFKSTFTKSGEIVADESYVKADKDFTAQLTHIASKNPDAIYVPGYYTNIVGILSQARQKLSLKMPFFGGDGWDGPEVFALGPVAEGCFFTNHYAPDDPSPGVQKFIAAYKTKYNQTPDAMAITGYDAAKTMIDAVRRAGKVDRDAVRDAIAQTKDFPGADGDITIDASHNSRKQIVVVEIRGGAPHLVEAFKPD